MNFGVLLINLLNPPVLFFFLGASAVLLRSDLELPNPIPKLLSLYLLMAIGFKGGAELRSNGLGWEVAAVLFAVVCLGCLIPLYTFYLMRGRFSIENAAAIAATYGSVSAVTFITAGSFVRKMGVDYSGYMVAAMAVMESPAIIFGVMLARKHGARPENGGGLASLLKDGFLNGSVFLLLGSLLIGYACDPGDALLLDTFTKELFAGVLCLFLLDMGVISARRVEDAKKAGWFLPAAAVGMPIANAMTGLLLARLIGLSVADSVMFTVLAASASYIAVPAAMRMALPDANPGIYVTMSLGITFPFNILVGIPVYYKLSVWLEGLPLPSIF